MTCPERNFCVYYYCQFCHIFRLDTDQSARRIAIKAFEAESDYYEFEGSHYTELLLFFPAFREGFHQIDV